MVPFGKQNDEQWAQEMRAEAADLITYLCAMLNKIKEKKPGPGLFARGEVPEGLIARLQEFDCGLDAAFTQLPQ